MESMISLESDNVTQIDRGSDHTTSTVGLHKTDYDIFTVVIHYQVDVMVDPIVQPVPPSDDGDGGIEIWIIIVAIIVAILVLVALSICLYCVSMTCLLC